MLCLPRVSDLSSLSLTLKENAKSSLNDFKPHRTGWRDIFGKGYLPVVPEITRRGCIPHLANNSMSSSKLITQHLAQKTVLPSVSWKKDMSSTKHLKQFWGRRQHVTEGYPFWGTACKAVVTWHGKLNRNQATEWLESKSFYEHSDMRSRWVFYQSKQSHSDVLFSLLQRDPATPFTAQQWERPLRSGPVCLGLRSFTYDLPNSRKLLAMLLINKITNKKQNSKQKVSLNGVSFCLSLMLKLMMIPFPCGC